MNTDELLIRLRPYLQQMVDDEVFMAKDAMAIVEQFDAERDQKILIFGSDRVQQTHIVIGGVDISHLVRKAQITLTSRTNPVLSLELTRKPQIEISDEAAAKILMYYSEDGKMEEQDSEG